MKAPTIADIREKPANFITGWWQNWKKRRAALIELESCDTGEVAHLARDVGVAPSELRTLAARWPDESDLLSRRLGAMGLEQSAQAEPQVLRDLQRVCGQCVNGRRCAHDLNDDPSDRSWRDYCPNVATLDALRSEERDRRLMRRRK